MTVLEVSAEAVMLRAQVVVYEARMEVAALHCREFERDLFMNLRASMLAALAAIEDALGMVRTFPGRDAKARRRKLQFGHSGC